MHVTASKISAPYDLPNRGMTSSKVADLMKKSKTGGPQKALVKEGKKNLLAGSELYVPKGRCDCAFERPFKSGRVGPCSDPLFRGWGGYGRGGDPHSAPIANPLNDAPRLITTAHFHVSVPNTHISRLDPSTLSLPSYVHIILRSSSVFGAIAQDDRNSGQSRHRSDSRRRWPSRPHHSPPPRPKRRKIPPARAMPRNHPVTTGNGLWPHSRPRT